MSNELHNTPDSHLIYEHDELDLQVKAIQKRLKELRAEIDKRNIIEGKGKGRSMEIKDEPYDSLDEKKLKEDLGQDLLAPYITKKSKKVLRWKNILPEILRAA